MITKNAKNVLVPRKYGRGISVAVEDARPSSTAYQIENSVQNSIYTVNGTIDDASDTGKNPSN